MQHLVIIPGLGDDVRYTKFLVRNWKKKYKITPHVIGFGWSGEASEFGSKYKNISNYLDDLLEKEDDVSLLGISAGGSAVVNLFSERKNKIKKVITVCGRLSDININPSWKNNSDSLRILKESIKICEKNIENISPEDKKKIMTIRPFYDDIVPVRTMTIDGAKNMRVNSVQHMISIYLAMTLYSGSIVKFIKTGQL